MLCAMQVAVRAAGDSRGACALAAVTVAAENACAAGCKALDKPGVWGKAASNSRLWQNRPAVLSGIYFSQQSSKQSSGCLHKR